MQEALTVALVELESLVRSQVRQFATAVVAVVDRTTRLEALPAAGNPAPFQAPLRQLHLLDLVEEVAVAAVTALSTAVAVALELSSLSGYLDRQFRLRNYQIRIRTALQLRA